MKKTGFEHYGRTNSPCLNCSGRAQGCHSTCERYIKFKEIHEQERQAIFKKKHVEHLGFGPEYVGDRTFMARATEERKRKVRTFRQHKK